MNSYILSRQWFDFAFENPDKISVTQGALYSWLIEVNNRSGWAEKFAFNTEDACKAIGVNNRKTVWKALNELAETGFVFIVFKSGHRHKPSVISLPVTDHDLKGSLDKVLSYQSTERTSKGTVSGQVVPQYAGELGNSKETVSGHSNKPLNNKTINHKTEERQINFGAFDTPEFRAKWQEFLIHRKKIKAPIASIESQQRIFNKLTAYDIPFAIQLIEATVDSGKWQGLVFNDTHEQYKAYLNRKNGKPTIPTKQDLQEIVRQKTMVY